jgi:polyisoprenoid-binding protein YceI
MIKPNGSTSSPESRGHHGRVVESPVDGEYVLDTDGTTLAFRAKAFCVKWVTGTLRPVTGTITVEGGAIRGQGTADTTQVDTRLKPRDWHLRTSYYLHVAKHPQVRLNVDLHRLDSETAEAHLVVRDETVSFPVTIDEMRTVGDKLHVKVSGSFDRRALGMLPPIAGVSRIVHLDMDILASRRTD